jgi:hypothetical protein
MKNQPKQSLIQKLREGEALKILNIINYLKSTIMKKSLLIFILAMFATVTVTMAQAPNLTNLPNCPVPVAVTCLSSDALHPVPGTEYTYEVNVPTPPGTKYYNWLVTQDQTFITGSALTAAPEPNDGSGDHIQATGAGYNDPITGTNTIDITWKSWTLDPANPVFLVIYVQNDDACTTDNIKVYVIEPMHAFTLDLKNMDINGDTVLNDYAQCIDSVESAIYNVGAGELQYDFGENYMFFVVTAANFTHSWMPSFQIDGSVLYGSRIVEFIEWAYPADAVAGTWISVPSGGSAPGSIWQGTDPIYASDTTTVGADGECIVIRVTFQNNQVETLTDETFTLAINGIMLDPNAGGYTTPEYADIHWAEVGGVCPYYDDYEYDFISQILTARPDIQAVDPTPFEPTNAE